MKAIPQKAIVATILVALLGMTLGWPAPAFARYRDRSDELEGSSATPYIVIGGLGVAAIVVYLIFKRSDEDEKKGQEGQSSIDLNEPFPAMRSLAERSTLKPELRLTIDPLPDAKTIIDDGSTSSMIGVHAGLAFRF